MGNISIKHYFKDGSGSSSETAVDVDVDDDFGKFSCWMENCLYSRINKCS